MKKIFLMLFAIVFALFTVACSDKPGILFNKNPITKENVLDYSSVFKPDVRIYYLILMPKRNHSRYLYVQLIKKDNKEMRLGYKLYWTKTIRLKDEQENYFTDYVVVSEPGAYVMQVYSKDRPHEPMARAQFFVQN